MIRSQKGMTMVEILIGITVLSVVMLAGVSAFVSAKKGVHNTKMKLQSKKNVSAVVDSVMANSSMFVRHFRVLRIDERERLMQYETATIAFDEEKVYPLAQCKHCVGRIAYLLEPHPDLPGTYIVNMRVFVDEQTHNSYRFLSGDL